MSNFPIPKRLVIRLVIVLIAAVFGWFGKDSLADESKTSNTAMNERQQTVEQNGEFKVYLNCELVPSKYNDGDSFLVKHGDTEQEYRLYYVDTPESKDKPYDDHRERVLDQGRDLGGLGYEQTLKIGKTAQYVTQELLSKPFRVYTTEELVYQGPRQYAFVQVESGGKVRWLHEILIEKGLARIHTRGAATPEGESFYDHRDALRQIEDEAQDNGMGAWR